MHVKVLPGQVKWEERSPKKSRAVLYSTESSILVFLADMYFCASKITTSEQKLSENTATSRSFSNESPPETSATLSSLLKKLRVALVV